MERIRRVTAGALGGGYCWDLVGYRFVVRMWWPHLRGVPQIVDDVQVGRPLPSGNGRPKAGGMMKDGAIRAWGQSRLEMDWDTGNLPDVASASSWEVVPVCPVHLQVVLPPAHGLAVVEVA